MKEDKLFEAIEALNAAVAVMKRNNAVMSMQILKSPYTPIVRAMIKLGLIKDWLDPFTL